MNPLDQKNHYVKEFMSTFTAQYPKSDEIVLMFIATFLTAAGTDQTEVIRKTFRAGYCYYFVLMLYDAFPDGEICWAAPFGHIVYVNDKIAYDIEGVYEGEAEMFITVKRLGEAINDFRHIDGLSYNITEQEIAQIMLEWKRFHQESLFFAKNSKYEDFSYLF